MVNTASNLLVAALAPSSRKNYGQAIHNFKIFVEQHMRKVWFPADVQSIALYIAFMVNKGWAPSTILTNISAISFFYKLMNVYDPTSPFIIKKILSGVSKLYKTVDTRLPISVDILRKLIESTYHVSRSAYEATLYRCMYILMFYGFMRIGEATKSLNNIQFSQVCLSPSSVAITFRNFKHHKGAPVILAIPASGTQFCPLRITKE